MSKISLDVYNNKNITKIIIINNVIIMKKKKKKKAHELKDTRI